jgi:hypothetical protein
MGATDSLRSIKTLGFSEEMAIFPVFSMLGAAAAFLRIPGSLSVAEESNRQEYLVSSRRSMATIKA